MTENFEREKSLFNEALELPSPEARRGFLKDACGPDDGLRDRIEALIDAYESATAFIPTHERETPGPSGGTTAITEQPGDVIGPYKLLAAIGEGGFGTVWMADQSTPVRRRVAMKIIKPGLDSREVIARFAQERQALAIMDHANIARILDAGATQSGRPFFVMELVRGVKITDYCDEQGLDIAERVRLFLQVCHAVHHAHQKGVIHRDIKPSNVLVTVNDGEAVVKVIDFGVAKATQGSLTDATVFTQFFQMIGTPAYMSPEQAEMTSLDIDTRSDIYSLGVLLYELITGDTPIDAATLARAGLDEIRRVIREVTPPRPSTWMRALSAEKLTTAAKRRRTAGAKLFTLLRGDLDWIVMMCLEKDRKRRYDSANALALDLARYLDHGIVTARPPTMSYLMGRIVRRHRFGFAAAAAALVALLAGLGIALWQYSRAKAAETEQSRLKESALTEAVRSRRVADLLENMLRGVNPAQARGRDTTILREILDRTDAQIDADLHDQPEVAADLRITLGKVYLAVGEVPKAAAMHRSALELYRRVFGSQHPKILQALNNLGFVLAEWEQLEEAEKALREALAMSQSLNGREHVATARVLNSLGFCLNRQQRYADAEGALRETIAVLEKSVASGHPDLGGAMVGLGESLAGQHQFPEAETVLRKSVEILKQAYGDGGDHPAVADSLASLGSTLTRAGRPAEALPVLQEALAMERKLYGKESARISDSLVSVAQTLAELGRLPEAESHFRDALEVKQKVFGEEHTQVANILNDLGWALAYQSKYAEAEDRFQQAIAMKGRLVGKDHLDVAEMLDSLGSTLSVQSKHEEAEQAFRDSLAIRIKQLDPGDRSLGDSYQNLGVALANQGRAAEGVVFLQQSLDLRRKLPGFQHPATAGLLQLLTINLMDLQRDAEAESPARECMELREKLLPDGWETSFAQALLGACLLHLKKYGEAEPLLKSGCLGMIQRKDTIPENGQVRVREGLEAAIRLHTESGHAEEAAEWKRILADLVRPVD